MHLSWKHLFLLLLVGAPENRTKRKQHLLQRQYPSRPPDKQHSKGPFPGRSGTTVSRQPSQPTHPRASNLAALPSSFPSAPPLASLPCGQDLFRRTRRRKASFPLAPLCCRRHHHRHRLMMRARVQRLQRAAAATRKRPRRASTAKKKMRKRTFSRFHHSLLLW